jgi:aspartate carbamoyltransferase catalytic subunit
MMAPRGRELPEDVLASLPANIVSSTDQLDALDLDVLYMAGLPNIDENTQYPEPVRSGLILTCAKAEMLSSKGIIMCPLPRLDEIETAVDSLPGAVYFNQSADGLFVRMATLEGIFL